jgi:YD repeat-containing protein
MNWDGVTPYSTTTTKYDALDRAVRVRSYAGALTGEEPAADGDAYQTTTYAYDGHGRLLTSHLPGQAAGTATAYEYYADDAVKSVTDARGVRTGYEYDGRHLVKKVKYNELGITSVSTDKPQGTTPVAAAPDVTYAYDAAGNRTSTTTAGGAGGGGSYHYDLLSRLDWEQRTLPGLSSTYLLSYAYTASGALRQVTDQDGGKTYTYGYDRAGRMGTVKGTGFGEPETTFATAAGYRAWGVPKGVMYGNPGNQTGDTYGYDARGLVTEYHVTGLGSTAARSTAGTSSTTRTGR